MNSSTKNNSRFGMRVAISLVALVIMTKTAMMARFGADSDKERGDVPGWVMVTLMSAILVAGLLALAGPALAKMFNEAMGSIRAPGR